MPDDPHVCVSGGWDRIMKLYDTRIGKPVAQILGPLVSGDCIDINGDTILAGSNRHEKPLAIYSISMRKTISEIAYDPSPVGMPESGYVLAARFSKDPEGSLVFAGGAGRNELKAFDNDSDQFQRYKELGHLNDNRHSILCMDTSKNGKWVAWGNSYGQVFMSPYELNGAEEEPDLRTVAGRVAAKRSKFDLLYMHVFTNVFLCFVID